MLNLINAPKLDSAVKLWSIDQVKTALPLASLVGSAHERSSDQALLSSSSYSISTWLVLESHNCIWTER
jgi:hypothetical protein